MPDRTFVSHLECAATGAHYPAGAVHGLSDAGKPLLVRYDLDALGAAVSRDAIGARREGGFWRYAEFLPVRHEENRLRLGEVTTPLIPLARRGRGLLVKDEGRLPTGSFKARGLALGVSMAKELGLTHLAMPTNGNAGAAMAAYARRGGLRATVFCPADTPEINVREIAVQGAEVYRVNGLINDCGKLVGQGKATRGWFDLSTLKEPYRIEGKKTMGIELAEQLGWRLPEAIFYPTGGGTGMIGMWKAFHELRAIGWLTGPLPKMIAVQASGCAPIVKAWRDGADHAPLWPDARTVAAGIRVPVAVGDFLILQAVRESGGWAEAVDDEAIMAARDDIAARDGLLLCPEGAATYAAWAKAVADGRLSADAEAVLFNCATGLKYPLSDTSGFWDTSTPVTAD
jgi:threonine synthase